jgi:quercetin dioxygenase-like cupin family protein
VPDSPAATQAFLDPHDERWIELMPGVSLLVLAEPVPGGSIHRARLTAGTVIPVHTHPADEFVQVLAGTIETGGRRCTAGTFWTTPRGVRQGPHVAIDDVELLTIRLGPMGVFGEAALSDG